MASDPASSDVIKGFGQFCVDLETHLPKRIVVKLATVFEFSEAEVSNLNSVSDPAPEFVRCMKWKGIIKEDNISNLTGVLKRNDLDGIAAKVQSSFDKNVKASQGEIVHTNYPFLSTGDFEDYKDDVDDLRVLNKKSSKDCKKRFQNYSLETNFKGERQAPTAEHLRVAMIGKTGSGKSATANSLLGEKKFREGHSAVSQTVSSGIATSEIGNGRRISVVDSPGMKDTHISDDVIMQEIGRAAYLLRDGIHAFILVWNASDIRFTAEARDIVNDLKKGFGESFTNHCLFVYSNAESRLNDTSLDAFISDQKKHDDMRTFLDEIDWKIVAVNNRTDIPAEQKRNQDTLVDMIDKIINHNGNKIYTNDVFRKASTSHQKVKEECKICHPALVAAVIELYNSSSVEQQKTREIFDQVITILMKSKTGELIDCGENVKLLDEGKEQILSCGACKYQIDFIYNSLGGEINDLISKISATYIKALRRFRGLRIL